MNFWQGFKRSGKCAQVTSKRMETRTNDYNAIIRAVQSLLLGEKNYVERCAIYDFAIWTLGNQIVADGFRHFISDQEVTENRNYDIQTLLPEKESTQMGQKEIDLARVPTYTGLWSIDRFSRGIRSILAVGFRHELAHNVGIYYPELNFAVMLSGRHHTSWAVFLGSGVQPMNVISLEPYFSQVQTDGNYFTYSDDFGNQIQRYVEDYRFAAMFRLAQMKHTEGLSRNFRQEYEAHEKSLDIAAQADRMMVDQKSVEKISRIYEDKCRELRTTIYCQEQQITWLNEQLIRKAEHIQKLEQQLSSSNV